MICAKRRILIKQSAIVPDMDIALQPAWSFKAARRGQGVLQLQRIGRSGDSALALHLEPGQEMKNISTAINQGPFWLLFLAATVVALSASEAVAASAHAPRQPVGGLGLLLAAAIPFLSRRRAIGGWLLYFYIQLYATAFIALVFLTQLISDLNPRTWDDPLLYVMFFLSVVPVYVAQVAEVLAATILLFWRNEKNLMFLRTTLFAVIAASAATVTIDAVYFSDDTTALLGLVTLVFAIVWSLYFSKARRIRMVFVDRNWDYASYSQRRLLSSGDRVRLRRRVLFTASATFGLLLWAMALDLKAEGNRPDLYLLVVPLVCAVVVAIIAWYLPIKRMKSEAERVIRTGSRPEDHDNSQVPKRQVAGASWKSLFGFFKNNKSKSDSAVRIAVELLEVQLVLSGEEDDGKLDERVFDSYSRGYIFGVCDALLQVFKVEGEDEMLASMTFAHLELFGSEYGAKAVGRSLREQGEILFEKGRMRGGQELLEFFRTKKPPMGLAGYLLHGEM